jgi:hypothetical protein
MATKKVKRYDGEDGSLVTADDLETANASSDPIAELNKRKGWTDTEEAPAKAEPVKAAPAKAEPVKAAPALAKVVTKEELAKSGLSLRDYLNKQQGLTRKGGSAPSSSGGGRGPTADELAAYTSAKKEAIPKASASRSGMLSRMRAADKDITGVRDTESAPSAPRATTKINPEDLKGRMKGMGGDSGFAKGGAVSASRRGDGIASKGKTRGRMC